MDLCVVIEIGPKKGVKTWLIPFRNLGHRSRKGVRLFPKSHLKGGVFK
jgi:hypothetical protein